MYLAARIAKNYKMKKIQALLLLALVALSGCSSTDEPAIELSTPEFTFEIKQDRETVTEFDEINFTLVATESQVMVTHVSWFINGAQQEAPYADMRKLFERAGSYTIRAEVNYQFVNSSNQATKTVIKNITVAGRPSYTVQLKKVEILSNVNDSDFYVPLLGYYMLAKYEIEGIDDQGAAYVAYMSPVNSANTGGSMQYPISWDMTEANQTIKVYESGNYYPYNLWYNSRITFYAANRGNGGPNPYFAFKTLFVNLNPYRLLKPTQLEVSDEGVAYRLTLDWN